MCRKSFSSLMVFMYSGNFILCDGVWSSIKQRDKLSSLRILKYEIQN